MHAMCTLRWEGAVAAHLQQASAAESVSSCKGALTRLCLHAAGGKPRFAKGAYVLGKIVWGKGEQLANRRQA